MEYSPTLFAPLAEENNHIHAARRVRFAMEYIHQGKYKVYYLQVGDELVAYCMVAPGGRRLKVSQKTDIVLGPYYVKPAHRGKGYSKWLIQLTLEHCSYQWQRAWDWIHKSNTPSIRCSEACGFNAHGRLNVVGQLRRLVEDENGDYIIYTRVHSAGTPPAVQ